MSIRAVSSLSLYLSRLERGFGGLFLELLRRWSNRSRFCTKPKKAAEAKAKEEAEADTEAAEGGAESEELSEGDRDRPEEEKTTEGGSVQA